MAARSATSLTKQPAKSARCWALCTALRRCDVHLCSFKAPIHVLGMHMCGIGTCDTGSGTGPTASWRQHADCTCMAYARCTCHDAMRLKAEQVLEQAGSLLQQPLHDDNHRQSQRGQRRNFRKSAGSASDYIPSMRSLQHAASLCGRHAADSTNAGCWLQQAKQVATAGLASSAHVWFSLMSAAALESFDRTERLVCSHDGNTARFLSQ